MVNPKTIIEQSFHLFVSGGTYFMAEVTEIRMVLTAELCQYVFLRGRLLESQGGLDRFLPGMDKYHDLVSGLNKLRNLLESYEIQVHS